MSNYWLSVSVQSDVRTLTLINITPCLCFCCCVARVFRLSQHFFMATCRGICILCSWAPCMIGWKHNITGLKWQFSSSQWLVFNVGNTVCLRGTKKVNGRKTGGADLSLPKIRRNPLIEIIAINTGYDYCHWMLQLVELYSYIHYMVLKHMHYTVVFNVIFHVSKYSL